MDLFKEYEIAQEGVKCRSFKQAFLYDEVLTNVFKFKKNKFGIAAMILWILDHRYGALVNIRLYQLTSWKRVLHLVKFTKTVHGIMRKDKYSIFDKLFYSTAHPSILWHFLLFKLYNIICTILERLLMIVYILDISPYANIGKRFWGVFRNVAITMHTKIGSNVIIEGNVTIAPTVVIKDYVHIHTGAVIMGKNIEIGEGAIVGANSLVTRSVQPNSTVLGVPARAIFIGRGLNA